MFQRFFFILLLLLILSPINLFTTADDSDVRRIHNKARPASVSAPLTPSLQCSACEVAVRELSREYLRRSVHDKFFGTDVELQDVMDEACRWIPRDYYLAQEGFGSRLKVFAKRGLHYDIQNTERVQFYSDLDEHRYINAVHRLKSFCETFLEKFRDSHFARHVTARTPEKSLKIEMCYENATKLCAPETLEPYVAVEQRKRRRWKRSREYEDARLAELKKQMGEAAGGVDPGSVDVESTEEL